MTLAILFAGIAAYIDLRERRIPNQVVLAGVAVVLLAQFAAAGWGGCLDAALGFGVGLLLMLPFYAVHAMGAGDAKLMAMVGAGVGPVGVVSVTVLTFVIGGVLALVLALANGKVLRLLSNVRAMLFGAFTTMLIQRKAEVIAPAKSAGHLPYAVPIALGTVLHVALLQAGMRIL